jgi:hypothetical protein
MSKLLAALIPARLVREGAVHGEAREVLGVGGHDDSDTHGILHSERAVPEPSWYEDSEYEYSMVSAV